MLYAVTAWAVAATFALVDMMLRYRRQRKRHVEMIRSILAEAQRRNANWGEAEEWARLRQR